VGAEQPLGQVGSAISAYITAPSGTTGKLTVDPDGVEVLIEHLKRALEKIKEAGMVGKRLMQVEPPGDDPFSPIAVADIKRTAGDQPGGHLYANFKAQQAYQAIIDNLTASLAVYREQEARGIERFRGST
jgi:hypothetical protein